MLLKIKKICRVNLEELPLSMLLNYFYSHSKIYPAKQVQIWPICFCWLLFLVITEDLEIILSGILWRNLS